MKFSLVSDIEKGAIDSDKHKNDIINKRTNSIKRTGLYAYD